MGNVTPYTGQAATSKQITDIMSTINRVEFALVTNPFGTVSFTDFGSTIGSFGFGQGQLELTLRVETDSNDNVYISGVVFTELHTGRVNKFNSAGNFLLSWDTPTTSIPGLHIDASDNVFIGHFGLIEKYDSLGNFILSFSTPSGRLEDLTTNSVGWIYSTNNVTHQVHRFSSTGTLLSSWGSLGTGDGQFDVPSAIAVDVLGNVYVCDDENDRIQKFTNMGVFIDKFTVSIDPGGLAIDLNGNIYVSTYNGSSLQVFDSAFVELGSISTSANGIGHTLTVDNSILWRPSPSSAHKIGVEFNIIVGNPLLDSFGLTDWQKYGSLSTSESLDRVAAGIPEVADNAFVVPIPQSDLQIGERYDPMNVRIVRDMRTAMEALAASGLITNIATGNTLTWDFTSDDDLYKSATAGKLTAMGRTTGTHSWARDLPSMSGTLILDIDIAEMRLVADFLEACVNA